MILDLFIDYVSRKSYFQHCVKFVKLMENRIFVGFQSFSIIIFTICLWLLNPAMNVKLIMKFLKKYCVEILEKVFGVEESVDFDLKISL